MSSLPLETSIPLPSTFPTASKTHSITCTPISGGYLDTGLDARHLVRLVQCSHCWLPLHEPVTLPCGNSLCKRCIPPLHSRTHVSYPATANRLQAFTCPFSDCGRDHVTGDYSLDVVLNKVMEVVRKVMDLDKELQKASSHAIQVEEISQCFMTGVPSLQEPPLPKVFRGGQLAATYQFAALGRLAYDSEIEYTFQSSDPETTEALDIALLKALKEAARSELDCQVCYGLFLDPFTTNCGHTLCRKCIHRVQDHSNLCPICRRHLGLPPGVKEAQAPSNLRIGNLLSALCPADLLARQQAAIIEESIGDEELDTPLFVCTLSFPWTPTFLHIFEPRYKLMIRRAMESNKRFGMLLHNRHQEPQGDLGLVPFYQYGTMLEIINMHLMPDGRSIIETTGVSRFRVLKYGERSGYMVGKVERIDDMAIAEEEAIEASETSSSPPLPNLCLEDFFDASPLATDGPRLADLDRLPTQKLMEIGYDYVKKMRETSAPWLHQNIVQAYGECPKDPALFPWWFASVVPASEAEKYRMLETNSVRQRLKMCVVFAVELARQRSQSRGCSVL